MTVIVPDTLKVPEELANTLLIDSEYYKIGSVALNELVDRQFLEGFLKKGSDSLSMFCGAGGVILFGL